MSKTEIEDSVYDTQNKFKQYQDGAQTTESAAMMTMCDEQTSPLDVQTLLSEAVAELGQYEHQNELGWS